MRLEKTILFIIVLICCCQVGYGQLVADVDERFELTSITARLAEYHEYSQCAIPSYASDIDEYFAPYKKHPLISFLKKERRSHGISYNCISSAAYALNIRDGELVYNSLYDLNKRADVEAIDPRWSKQTLLRYIELLNDFYRMSDFHKFYEQHTSLYSTATKAMDAVLLKVDGEWFEDFYGVSFGQPSIYVSLTNGPSNYALLAPDNNHGILIGTSSDSNGSPSLSLRVLPTIIHELNHTFANPLAFEFESEMKVARDKIGPSVMKLLQTGAYNTRAILPEWLTRLGTLIYLDAHNYDRIPFAITRDAYVGFIWQQRAFDFMANFSANRDLYPHFRDFMPQMVAFLNFTADNLDKVLLEYEHRKPYVRNIYPAAGSELDLTQEVVEIVFSFSEPMATHADGMRLVGNNLEAISRMEIPEGWEIGKWRDDKTYVVRLKSDWIKMGEVTGVALSGAFILDTSNYSLENDYTVTYTNFKTK